MKGTRHSEEQIMWSLLKGLAIGFVVFVVVFLIIDLIRPKND